LHPVTNTMSEERSLNFIEEIVEGDIAAGKNGGRV
jgi:glutaminyl-tRNA synthetase